MSWVYFDRLLVLQGGRTTGIGTRRCSATRAGSVSLTPHRPAKAPGTWLPGVAVVELRADIAAGAEGQAEIASKLTARRS